MMIWLTKKLKERKERKIKCEQRREASATRLREIASSLVDLNQSVVENTELLQPMVENLAKFLEVQLAATERSLKDYKDYKPTEDDLIF